MSLHPKGYSLFYSPYSSKFSLFLVPLNKLPQTFFCGFFSWLENFIYFVPH